MHTAVARCRSRRQCVKRGLAGKDPYEYAVNTENTIPEAEDVIPASERSRDDTGCAVPIILISPPRHEARSDHLLLLAPGRGLRGAAMVALRAAPARHWLDAHGVHGGEPRVPGTSSRIGKARAQERR